MAEKFIEEIAKYVQKYARQYGIKVHSPIIAQAILESGCGTSELAKNACNYFGLKYRPNRCPSASGIYNKIGSEQINNGKYISSNMQWMKFDTMADGVKGYFDFINIPNYANLKGVTEPKKYLELIKADKYATSHNYVQNLLNVIKKYNLTQYDIDNNTSQIVLKLYRVQVGAYAKESNAQIIKEKLKNYGYDCIVKKIDGLYKCQVGAFSVEDNARDLQRRLRNIGFNSFVAQE